MTPNNPKLNIEERCCKSTDADWDGDKYVDQSDYKDTELDLTVQEFTKRVSSLVGPKSKLYISDYEDALTLQDPIDGNEYYAWTIEDNKIWSDIFGILERGSL